MSPDTTPFARSSTEVLLWQARVRAGASLVLGAAAVIATITNLVASSVTALSVVLGVYLTVVIGTAFVARKSVEVPRWASLGTLLADVGFIFAFTAASSAPAYYGRPLIVAFLILHIAQTYYGSAHALVVLGASLVVYLALVATAAGQGLEWSESIWTAALFTAAGLILIAHYHAIQRRLFTLVALFERAEDGDFVESYDVKADRYPDAVTRVGRAYNRVRLQLASMVQTDPLTGCLNRRGFDHAMAREVSRTARSGHSLSLLALDLDHFKLINDNYGHLAGDSVLREFGGLLVQTARAGDMVARTGGEEFSILLPDTATGGAAQFASRLCDAVRRQVFHVNGKPISVTISVGVATTAMGAGDDLSANMKERADQALYAAKRGGRDQVQVWTSGEPIHTPTQVHLLSG